MVMQRFKAAPKRNAKLMGMWISVFAVVGVSTLLLTRAATSSTTHNGTSTTCVGLTNPAFCESFDQPFTANPSWVRSGDLNSEVWGVSRTGAQGNRDTSFQWYAPVGYTNEQTTPIGCGIGQAPNDVRVCNGRLIQAVNDGNNGNKTTMAIYPKQPFNFANRTGTIVFDVSSDSDGPHMAWPEIWITDQPIPAPGADDAGEPRNGLGLLFSGTSGCNPSPNELKVYKNYQLVGAPGTLDWNTFRCPTGAHANSPTLNHVRITISRTQIKVYMTEPGSTTEALMMTYNDLDLPFEQGLVWMADAHYNACKFGPQQCDHAFAWDNFGFDGPKTYRDLSFDAADHMEPRSDGSVNLGWQVDAGKPQNITVNGVHKGDKTATSALVVFNSYTLGGEYIPSVSVNGNPPIANPWVYNGAGYTIHSIATPIPLNQIKTDGSPNLIKFTSGDFVSIANINLVLVDAQTVPDSGTTPPPTAVSCDFTSDGKVGVQDLVAMINNYGKTVAMNTNGDCSGDGKVGIQDLVNLINQYGK